MSENIRNHYLTLIETATSAAEKYYQSDILLMSDDEYDGIIDELEALSDTYGWTEADELLTAVAAGTSVEGADVAHVVPMLSLGKANSIETLKKFFGTINKGVVVEPKFDGLAISATYRNGNLTQVATRGNGVTGEDITRRSSEIKGLPASIAYKGDIEIRGEVFITFTDFETANRNRLAYGYNQWASRNISARKVTLESLYKVAVANRAVPNANRKFLTGDKSNFFPDEHIFANERNAVSGSLRKEDKGYEVPMSFSCYDVLGADDLGASYTARLASLETYGFTTSTMWMPIEAQGKTVLETLDLFGKMRENRTLTYPTDGIVFKADSFIERETLGSGSRHPRWAVAYKYKSEPEITVLRGVELTIGRTGRLALRAVVDPVLVDGTRIEYVSLHNASWLQNKDLRIGDTVLLRRANDVIPQIDNFIAEKRPVDAVRWVPPVVCPNCGGEWDKTTLLWRCESLTCGSLNSVIFASGRDYFDWEGMSEAIITRLNDTGKVNDIADVFDLTFEDLANLDTGRVYGENHKDKAGEPILLGETVARKIFDKIQVSKQRPFASVLAALGIRSLGRTFGRRLVQVYPDMASLLKASVTDLQNIEGIAVTKAELIHAGLVERHDVIVRLAKQGVNMKAPVKKVMGSSALSGKKIVISGSVPGYTRTSIQDKIAELGGVPSSSVSSSTDILVADDSATENSKYKKAVALGTVKIMSPEQFASML